MRRDRWLAAMLLCAVSLAGAWAVAEDAKPKLVVPVRSAKDDVVIEQSESSPSFYQNINRPGSGAPEVKPAAGNHFVCILAKADFPKGDRWDISAFKLKDSEDKSYSVTAFDFGDVPSMYLLYLSRTGALGIYNAGKKCALDLVDQTGRFKTKAGTVMFPAGGWPGGSDRLWLVFETPKKATGLVLNR